MRIRLLYLILAIISLSCGETEIDKPLNSVNSNLLVVEAVLTNEKANHKIKLTRPHQNINGSLIPISGAAVTITEGASITFSATEVPPGSGEYFTEEMTAVFGRVYTLHIRHQGMDFFARATSVPVQPLQPLQYFALDDSNFQLIFAESGSDPYYIDYQISWKNTTACPAGESCNARIVSYDLKTIDVNSLFKPDKENFTLPLNSVVIRKKYSVSPDYKNFLRSVLSETEWRGGIFDVQRENVPTNLSAGAIGFFAVSTAVSDTTLVVKKP